VTDQGKKPVLDERTFERLLEAAYVLQEHNRRMRELEEKMGSRSDQLLEQESASQAPAPRASASEPEEKSRSSHDYTLTLAEIVEAQRQIQMRHLELDKAMALVAERVTRITGASGAGIAILDGSALRYRAGAGGSALPVGSEVALDKAVCAASLRTGQVIRSADVNPEFLFDPEPCRQRGILSLVAVPIYREDAIAGALELYFDKTHGFAEQDIHTCQLMAGLVTEAIGRDAELILKKSMAAERSTMLAAIEKLQPNLAAWAEGQAAGTAPVAEKAAAPTFSCWKCGSALLAEEQFCGKCGASRSSDSGTSSMQSKVASAWQMQRTSSDPLVGMPSGSTSHPREISPVAGDTDRLKLDMLDLGKLDLGKLDLGRLNLDQLNAEFEAENAGQNRRPGYAANFAASADDQAGAASLSPERQLLESQLLESQARESQARESQPDGNVGENHVGGPAALVVKPQEAVVWTSAAKARDFLESLSSTRTPNALIRFWRSRRGDFYLAVAVILVVAVIRWGIWSSHSVGATGHASPASGSASQEKQQPDAEVSTFDRLLISLGLAEAPQTPEYHGNPETQVWVDLHTALYYCPGSDLYGKTTQGKVTSQRDAQLDQFQPANRKACD
jgi:putative methionine-R-sulfoxide reductase with GAF domain